MMQVLQPRWVRALSDVRLVDSFCETLDALDKGEAVQPRLDVLYHELRRREEAGTMDNDAWLAMP